MRHYLLSVVQPSALPPSAMELDAIARDVDAFDDELKAADAWVFSGGLGKPADAVVLRAAHGETLATRGPYSELEEYLGGLCIIRAADFDAALAWGRKAARATRLPIEVRAFEEQPGE